MDKYNTDYMESKIRNATDSEYNKAYEYRTALAQIHRATKNVNLTYTMTGYSALFTYFWTCSPAKTFKSPIVWSFALFAGFHRMDLHFQQKKLEAILNEK
jgi:hypothetical protein